MSLFGNNVEDPNKVKQHTGVFGLVAADVIKWEPEGGSEAEQIAHKFEYEDFPDGSTLIVGPSQMAVFINNMSAGDSLGDDGAGRSQMSVFIGPEKIRLETGNSRFAPFRKVKNAMTGGDSAYHCTVYFINTTYMTELRWGTQDPIVVQDPEEDVNVHVRANGLFGTHIEQNDESMAAVQANKFLRKVVGTRSDYSRAELISFTRAKILEFVPNLLAQNMVDKQIGILKIATHLSEFSEAIREKLIPCFDEFGLTLDNFSFNSISAPDEDLEAINDLKIKKKQRQLEAEGNAIGMDIESEALARKRAREGYSYQQEQAFGVFQTAAANEGTASGLMGAGMGLGMGFGVGGAMGQGMQNMAGVLNGINMQTTATAQNQSVKCPSCGAMLTAEAKFCLQCGAKIESEPQQFCPECGAKMVAGAKFCMNCGHKMSAQAVCPGCGKEVPAGAKFCLECGTKIE